MRSPDVQPGTSDAVRPSVRRFAIGLGVFFFLVLPLAIAGLLIGVDPYYVFGSPSWPGFNAVRPYYEPYVVAVKPYQIWRMRPQAVILGASSPEVGIDPRHPGWGQVKVFNFSIPSSNSYAIMLAFLHAQKLGAKQAVVSLDFFSFNMNFSLGVIFDERRFAQSATVEFARYLDETLPSRPKIAPPAPTSKREWNETFYLALHQDVAAAIARGEFNNAREHWELAGRAEGRQGAPPEGWDEVGYLQAHIDVAREVAAKTFVSGYHHFYAAGRAEGRLGGLQPSDWDEAGYLAANPDARVRVALGTYRTGFVHYAAVGRKQGRLGGLPPANAIEKFRRGFPGFDKTIFNIAEFAQLALSMRAAVSTIFRQNEPADFDDLGMRVWRERDEFVRKYGGSGKAFRDKFALGGGSPWLPPPTLQYCFSNAETGVTTFDPFRFMLRRAYAEGTDLRMFTTPSNAAIYQLFLSAGLYQRYEIWLKELVRINEEEASRAGHPPFPLWNFGYINSITSEPIPQRGDLSPMKYYWEYAHYRRTAGDLILDRVLNYRSPARHAPDDFGVQVMAANIENHLAISRAKLADWGKANDALASEITSATQSSNARNRQAVATCW